MGVKRQYKISSIHFNLIIDVLPDILDKARMSGHLSRVVGYLIPGGGVTHLQYVDDTMIMVERSDLDKVNLKFLLFFKAMSGLKINFDKREVVILGFSTKEQ